MQYREQVLSAVVSAVLAAFKASSSQISYWTYSTYHQTDWDVTGSSVKRIVNQPGIFKIAPSQTTLHLPADHANSHEAEMTSRPAVCFVLRLARTTGRAVGRVKLLHAGLLPPTGRSWPLACRLQRHFSLAIMAAFFSISISKSPIFAGRLRHAHTYLSCHILYLTVFLGRLYGSKVFKR